ncbi:MAG: hypothetical protein ACE5LU_21670, partial [Anaerolineae bacterium]
MRPLNLPVAAILVLLPALILGACQLAVPTPQVNEVTFTVADYAFVGPESLPAGPTRIRIDNQSETAVQVQLIRLTDGQTVADFSAASQANPESQPGWIAVWFGHYVTFFAPDAPLLLPPGEQIAGLASTAPGQAGFLTGDLEPGNYALICRPAGPGGDDSDGVMGMMRGFT